MPRFKLLIEYEGTRYSGWQIQKNARTVQGEIADAARSVFKTGEFELYGSGRTDAGVHALEQVAHLDVNTVLAQHIIRMKLNDQLPADINILEVQKAPKNFLARHDALARSYLYQISRRRTAFGKKFVWWINDELNFHRMAEASKLFTGLKDFQSFSRDNREEKSTKVLVERIEMKEDGALILIRITGSHFLWKMVRQVVGVLVEVGRGNMSNVEVEALLKAQTGKPAKLTAPPSGLFLEKVFYEGDQHALPLRPVLSIPLQ